MICPKCKAELTPAALFCSMCGKKLKRSPNKRIRANGAGSVFKLANGKYKAVKTLKYETDDESKKHRRTRSCTFVKKSDGVAWLE